MSEAQVAQMGAIIAILVGMLTISLKMAGIVSSHAKLELKVETLWDFLMRRSLAQGLDTNIITRNSPIAATAPVESLLEHMAEELGKFYKEVGLKLNDRDLFIEIERHFGNRIMNEICIPNGLHQGACIFAAIDVAKKRGAS